LKVIAGVSHGSMSAFFTRGGKLLTYHGCSDQDIAPLASVNFYKGVGSALGDQAVSRSMRLFMVPGMGHCGGGSGVVSASVIESRFDLDIARAVFP
jgi:tannase/feruloyl esterase